MVNIRSAVFTFQEQQNHRWLKTNQRRWRDGRGGISGGDMCRQVSIPDLSELLNQATEFMSICVAAEVDFM